MCANKPLSLMVLGALIGLALAVWQGPANAQTIVTACGSDDAGGGMNLRDALAVGGAVVIRCADGSHTIMVTQTHTVPDATSVDGEGRVSLIGTGAAAMFNALGGLQLANLTVRNPRLPGGQVGPTQTGIVFGADAALELDGVRTEATVAPYTVASFAAVNSVFAGNGEQGPGRSYFVVDAEAVTLRAVSFEGNLDPPLGGGKPQAVKGLPASRSITIEDSSFVRNSHASILTDARVLVRRSTFIGNGQVPPENEPFAWSCCGGALSLVHSIAVIEDSGFEQNVSSGFGGAVQALGTALTIRRTMFRENRASAGGALSFWGRALLENVWSFGQLPEPPDLVLDRVQFERNRAAYLGGAVLWTGSMSGDGVVAFGNEAGLIGGAIAVPVSPAGLSDDFGTAIAALGLATKPSVDRLALSRAVLADNSAGKRGGAIEAAGASVALGNSLIIRNGGTAGAPGVAALFGADVSLANVTIARNRGPGIEWDEPSGSFDAANAIVAFNDGGNCVAVPGAPLARASLQFPGSGCTSAIAVSDPELGSDFEPVDGGPAYGGGASLVCLTHPLTGGVDVYGARRKDGACAVGAIEPQPMELSKFVGSGPHRIWMFWLLLILLALLIGLLFGAARRRRRYPKPTLHARGDLGARSADGLP